MRETLRRSQRLAAFKAHAQIRTVEREASHRQPARFAYGSLPDATTHIRLLKRRRTGAEVSFDIIHVDLTSAPPYLALSYTWGHDNTHGEGDIVPESIFLNGKMLDVTHNLHSALCHDVVPRGFYAWIDAICINQEDPQEKGQQVQRMRDIFRNAEYTVAWIGPCTTIGILFDISSTNIGKFFEVAAECRLPDLDDTSVGFSKAGRPTIVITDLDSKGEAEYNSNVTIIHQKGGRWHEILDDLMNRAYWYRLWILQEIAVSKKVVVQCGPWKLDLLKMEAVIRSTPYFAGLSEVQGSNTGQRYVQGLVADYQRLKRIFSIRRDFEQLGRPLDLSQLLDLSRTTLRVTDPRDRVYGVLGLVDPTAIQPVDYGKSVSQVYTETMARRLLLEGPDVLAEAQTGTSAKRADLPSWVADLDTRGLRSFTKQFLLDDDIFEPLEDVATMMVPPGMLDARPKHHPPIACHEIGTYCAARGTHARIRMVPEENQIILEGRRIFQVSSVAEECSWVTFGSRRTRTWLAELYGRVRFSAAIRWRDQLAAEIHEQRLFMDPDQSPPPLSEEENRNIRVMQRLHPYGLLEEHFAFLDSSMGPCFRQMCSSAKHTNCETPNAATDRKAFRRQLDFFDDERRAFRTPDRNIYGIGPEAVRSGDTVVIFHGGSVPHILRPLPISSRGQETWAYVGEAFMKSIMYGQAIATDAVVEDFVIA